MSFKSEAIIDLKDLILDKIFSYNDYTSHISDIDTYSGYINPDSIMDMNDINEDIAYYKEQYPELDVDTIEEIIQDNNYAIKESQQELGDAILDVLLPSGTKEALEKHGIKLVKTEYYMPQCYNYGGDRLDIHLEDMDPGCGDISPNIYMAIERFLNAAPKSCDGFISLLPSTVEECKNLDIPHIFAILYTEGILEDMVDNVEDYIQRAIEIIRDNSRVNIEKKLEEENKKALWNNHAIIKK